jgi:DNA gyrase subunit A
MNLGEGDTLLAIARNAEESADEAVGDDGEVDSQE